MPGPFYKNIKEQDSFDYNGITYNSSEFLSEDKPKKEIVIIPDTRYFPQLNEFVRDSDIIISECTYLDDKDAHHARKNYHLSILDIENFITESTVKRLFLTHISARYDADTEKRVVEKLGKIIEVSIAHDFDEYNL